MGADSGDADAWDDERPQHSVTITRSFLMARTEVTQAQYVAVTGLTNPSNFKGDQLPVEQVNWTEAVSFCNKLSELDGLTKAYDANNNVNLAANGYRLPTEAEWEYAARAGTTTPRYGDLGTVAWYAGNSGGTTHAVGLKVANVWGLYDILGNVWEWTGDWYEGYSATAVTDPTGASSGSNRVLRGGGWYSGARYVRAAPRNFNDPGNRRDDLGFRPSRSLP